MNFNSNKLSKQDKEALLQYTKHFIRKAVQIIVQSRLGEKKPTKSRVHAYNSDWFNLSIKDLVQITSMTKAALGTESIFTLGSPFCVEISLKTPENQTMILETWCIQFNDQLCDQTQKICYNVYKKMSLVLRSLLCMTRSMPTYQLSRRQSADTYVLLYRIYCDEPIVSHLGEKYATAKSGTISTPIGSLILNVAYRTRLTMTPSNSHCDAIYIKDDHFREELNNIDSENKSNSDPNSIAIAISSKKSDQLANQKYQFDNKIINENLVTQPTSRGTRSQPIQMINFKQNECESSPTLINNNNNNQNNDNLGDSSGEDCSRTSSIASTPTDTMYYFKLKSAAFAPSSFNNKEQLTLTSQINEVPPFMSLLCNEFSNVSPLSDQQTTKQQQQLTQAQQQRIAALQQQSPPPPSIDHNNTPNDNFIQQQQIAIRNNKTELVEANPDDFVFVETKKIAFGLSDEANDLSTFFRSCENAPILESFNTEPNLNDTLKDLDQQLLSYESKVAEFDDLVKSLEPN